MLKIGLSTPGFINEELFKAQMEAGITHMEVSVDKKQSEELDYKKIKKWAEKYNITLHSFHLPFYPFDQIDISRQDLAEESVKYLCNYIDKATEIGIKLFIIHASGEPIAESDRKARMECAKKSLYTLAEYARVRGATIAVEDLPRTCLGRSSDELLELMEAHPNLRACFDTNHLLNEKIEDFIKRVGDKIVTTHISDYDYIDERHWLPGEGRIDWQSLIGTLKEIGYEGVWLYEINLGCPSTIYRDRDLCCEDFARNASELFENKQMTIFSKPKLR